MMPASASLLACLQYGDSGFPSGGFAFSWGLEGLIQDGRVATPADVDALFRDLLWLRWHSFDRIVMRRICAALQREQESGGRAAGNRDDDGWVDGGLVDAGSVDDAIAGRAGPGGSSSGDWLDEVAALDRDVDLASWPAALRTGSRRAGMALLGVHERLGSPRAARYRVRVRADEQLGHLCVAQALVWSCAGLAIEAQEALGAWTLVSGLAAAAVRLGVLGHVDAQSALGRARRGLPELLAEVPADDALPGAFTPLIDVALMRHDRRDLRLFST